jgi:hypothetical protein
MGEDLFRRKANRLCVFFKEYGFVPLATEKDDVPILESAPPRNIGDIVVIEVEGKRRKTMFLRSHGHVKNSTYLVDLGPAKPWE